MSVQIALFAVAVVGLGTPALAALVLPSRDPPPPDLWTNYMSAAAVAYEDGDFSTAAIILNRAHAYAQRYAANTPRPNLSRLALLMAYSELGREDLMRPLSKEKLGFDTSQFDASLKSYIAILDRLAWTYYTRWNAGSDSWEEQDKQGARLYGAENSFKIAIALRERLMPDDQGLAPARAGLAFVLERTQRSESERVQRETLLRNALSRFRKDQRRRDTLSTAGTLFTNGGPNASAEVLSTTTEDLVDMQILVTRDLVFLGAAENLKRNDFKAFDEHAKYAGEMLEQMRANLGGLTWLDSPMQARFSWYTAHLYGLEYEMSKLRSGQYPKALALGEKAYEKALAIAEFREGPNSQHTQDIAGEYVHLLSRAGQRKEAATLAQHYRIAPK
jgi:hypothetical protein